MGCISESEFATACQTFSRYSDIIKDRWELCDHEGALYLVKKFMKMYENGELCTLECHIVYSSSYSCPTFYFLPFSMDGKMLTLEKCWNLVSGSNKHLIETDEIKWSFLTQIEHPFRLTPFYHFHPCHTQDFMKNVENCLEGKSLNYLLSWLSIVLQVLMLEFPLELYCEMVKGKR